MKKISQKRKMELSWYVKLNIMIMSFLFILFLMKQIKSPLFQTGLSNLFPHVSSQQPDRSVRIKRF